MNDNLPKKLLHIDGSGTIVTLPPEGTKLNPCPFCKNHGISQSGLYINDLTEGEAAINGGQHGCFVTCDCCQCDGPWSAPGQIEEAIKLWNGRSRKGW